MIEKTAARIGNRECYIYRNAENCRNILVQPVDEHDLEVLDAEVDQIMDMAGPAAVKEGVLLAAFLVEDWNRDLSPWEAPPVFGKEAFGHGAAATLDYIETELIPALSHPFEKRQSFPAGTEPIPDDSERISAATPRIYLGGYSLAAFFALWAVYQTDRFAGAAAASPSVWFPGWMAYAETHPIRTDTVYLSLGDREERTRNQKMKPVGDNIRALADRYQNDDRIRHAILEWNPGNHFRDSDRRTARAFAWVLQQTAAADR